ncbi:MAG: 50S ribosomal protein L22 [Armatimonadetes bacterium]|nr:50S ribosomal protein L22 [Armatimonadota bacterium]
MARAVARFIRTSPHRLRRVANLIRGKEVSEASNILRLLPNKGARLLRKVVESAAANAENNEELSRDNLFVARVMIDEGPTFKRFWPRGRGRADTLLKRTSHIMVEVDEKE